MTTSVPPVGELTSEQVESVRPAAGAGASWHDSRPWWLRCTPVAIELHAETTRAVSETGLEQRKLLLACGGALFNLRAAVRFLGFEPAVRYLPDRRIPNLLAAVRPTTPRAPGPADRPLGAAIAHLGDGVYPAVPAPVPATLPARLRQAAEAEQAWLATLAHLEQPAATADPGAEVFAGPSAP
ncbi:hypothetical protein ACIA5G_49655 [Amycolatopsis sp. NPDC051758]|uniref:hypothetical protein n=1 Tax=Amycolatopsis sp. NPDC051758 TaxID=3363935 RepID=UPI003792195D